MALWREVVGYEGLYLISNDGRVIAIPKTVKCGSKTLHRKQRPLKVCLRGKGNLFYEAVTLSKDGESKRFSVHRLVAQAFIPNPNCYPEVNHKDGNTRNNNADNLEWCTRQYNIEYSKNNPVLQLDIGGEVIAEYKSISYASKATGISRTTINNALCGWSRTAGGFRWAYCK